MQQQCYISADAAIFYRCRLAAAFDKSAEQQSGDAGTSGSESGQPSGQQGLLLLIPLMLGLNGKVCTFIPIKNQIGLHRR